MSRLSRCKCGPGWAKRAAATTLIVLGACRLPAPTAYAPTRTDRLVRAYPELRGGRFVLVADFENPRQMELFHLRKASPEASYARDQRGGRAETGPACLRFTSGSKDDAVIINNDDAANWYLKRDWRQYDLLLMAVYAPKPTLSMELDIRSGPIDDPQRAGSTIALRRGWNAVRIDLAEVGEHVMLDDVRALRLAVSGMKKPVDLRFDDIILTASSEDLFGDSSNSDGELYVRRAGRRWHIGAGGRFELRFANGQIVAWYNLARDPYRLRNLVSGTTLGPTPVVVGAEYATGGGFEALGRRVVSRQAILEMNAVRAVVLVEWRFVDDPAAPVGDRPFQRWLNTIYPTGQVFVAVEATGVTESWSPPGLGLAVALGSAEGEALETHVSTGRNVAPDQDQPEPPAYGTVRSAETGTYLVYVPSPSDAEVRLVEQVDAARNRVLLIAEDQSGPRAIKKWAVHLLLAGAGAGPKGQAYERALSYARPPALRVEVGSVRGGGGSAEGLSHGFDPSSGCYVLAPEGGQVRFVMDPATAPLFSPAFRVLDPQRRRAWVYVDHLILDRVARDREGSLLFQLPGVIRDRTVVEVLFRRSEGTNDG